jgi:Uma2 family endonuclease
MPPSDPPPTPNRKLWTRRDCEFLVNGGLLEGRYELIEGEVISKMGQKPHHAFVLQQVMEYLASIFGLSYVRGQSTLEVSSADAAKNEPEPDVVVTTLPSRSYEHRHPLPGEIKLIVEVSDSSVRFDLVTKAKLYARSRFPEYWVVDIPGRRVVVHRDPADSGYTNIVQYGEEETVSPTGFDGSGIVVAELLPSVSEE